MPIHLNPFRLYKGRVCVNHGILVDMLRSSHRFWISYHDLLALNGKKESDVNELKKVMDKMGIKPGNIGKVTQLKKLKVRDRVTEEFEQGLRDLDTMMNNLARILWDDETFLYRAVNELKSIYLRIRHIRHIPDYILYSIQHSLHHLIMYIEKKQHHAWVISKAHSRDAFKFSEVSIRSDRAERRRIRMQTIELDHLRNRIEPLKERVDHLRVIRTQEDIHRLYNDIHELLDMYHEEIKDLSHIMHETDILIRRTEKLFNHMSLEAGSLGFKDLKKTVDKYGKRFHQLLLGVEKQARREYMDIQKIAQSLPKPEGSAKEYSTHIEAKAA